MFGFLQVCPFAWPHQNRFRALDAHVSTHGLLCFIVNSCQRTNFVELSKVRYVARMKSLAAPACRHKAGCSDMKTILCSESDATCLHCVVVSANHFVASASCSHVHCRSIEAATLHRLPVACIYSTNSLRIGSTHILMLWNSPPTPRTPEQISFHELKAAPPQPGFRLRSSMRRAFRETGFTRCCGARVRTAGSSIPGTHFVAVHNYVLFSRHASAWTVLPCS